jgi:hypothetical protein
MNAVFDFLGGRKYFLAILFYVLVTVGFFISFMSPESWVQSLEWCLAIYLGANAIKKIPDAVAQNGDANGTNKFFAFFGGRKMFLALLFIVTTTVAFFIPKGESGGFLPTAEWVDGLKWCLIIYLGANAVEAVPQALIRKANGKKEEEAK